MQILLFPEQLIHKAKGYPADEIDARVGGRGSTKQRINGTFG